MSADHRNINTFAAKYDWLYQLKAATQKASTREWSIDIVQNETSPYIAAIILKTYCLITNWLFTTGSLFL